MSKEQDKKKEDLSSLIDQLNEVIEKATSKLYKKEKNPQTMKQLEHTINVRAKDLTNAKNQSKNYKQQFELLNTKANEKFTPDK
jgi:hypothetical protein